MRRDVLDPAVAAELQALDAAVAGTPGADPELLRLAADLRAVAPAPSPEFRARLDDAVDQRFARPPRRRWPRMPRGRLWLPAGGLAAAAVAAALVIGLGSAPRDDRALTSTSPQREASGSGASGDSQASSKATTAAPAAPPIAPERKVQRDVRLELGARPDRFDAVTDGVVRATQRAGGYVASSEVARGGRSGTASFVLRLPAARLDAALADLSRLGHVRSLAQQTQDLTGASDTVAARLRDARTRRRALVAAVATATGAQARRLQARLAEASARVRALERQDRALRARTSYATVEVTVVSAAVAPVPPPSSSDHWTLGDAWHDARRALEVAAGVAVITLALALPLALLVALGLPAGRALRRRRRDVALDRAA